MHSVKRRNIFLVITILLLAVIVAISVALVVRGPRESSVELISKTDSGELEVNDLHEGKMTIPYYDIPTNSYKPDDFKAQNGVVTYEGGESLVGINVNSKMGEIDWGKVKESGVDYALIRVGYRGQSRGVIQQDSNFKANITGAAEAGLPVGVYFYSKAVNEAEAEEEAAFVLEQIRGYKVKYPVAIFWEYDYKEDGTVNESSRTIQCNGDQVTGIIDAFCKKVKNVGFPAAYYATKAMGYEKLDLSRLSGYDMWYAEYQPVPSFYYDFKMWQYTLEGEVPGISVKVPITLSLKSYAK